MTDEEYERMFYEAEEAVRMVLADTNLKWRMTGVSSRIAHAVLARITTPAPGIMDVVDWIETHGGIMRTGEHYDVGGKYVDKATVRIARKIVDRRRRDAHA